MPLNSVRIIIQVLEEKKKLNKMISYKVKQRGKNHFYAQQYYIAKRFLGIFWIFYYGMFF